MLPLEVSSKCHLQCKLHIRPSAETTEFFYTVDRNAFLKFKWKRFENSLVEKRDKYQ